MSGNQGASIFGWLSPKRYDDQYLQLVNEHAANSEQCAVELNALFAHLPDDKIVKRIADFEHKGDDLAREAHHVIDRMFIPKFSKSDMTTLIAELDNVIDRMNQAAKSVARYRLTETQPETHRMTALILETVGSMRTLVGELRRLKVDKIRTLVLAIKEKEEESDTLWNEAIQRLYETEMNIKHYLAWKEVFDRLEQVVDACQNVGDVIAAIAREQSR